MTGQARRAVGDDSMFSVGQKVWHRNGQRSGTVLECDGDRVFIAQENGAELDFAASDLTATPPAAPKPAAGVQRDARGMEAAVDYAVPNRRLTVRDITPEHVRVLEIVPVRTMRAVGAVFERRPGVGRFSALSVAEKLNAITEITTVPFRTMRAYSDRPSELALLMGKGLADRRKDD
jgi:hypothetical protein